MAEKRGFMPWVRLHAQEGLVFWTRQGADVHCSWAYEHDIHIAGSSVTPCPDRTYHYQLFRRIQRRHLYDHIRSREVSPKEAAALLKILDPGVYVSWDECKVIADAIIDWTIEVDERIGLEAFSLVLHGLDSWNTVPWDTRCEALKRLGIPWPKSQTLSAIWDNEMPLFAMGAKAILPWAWRRISYWQRESDKLHRLMTRA